MKLHWGWLITFVFGTFVILICTMVYISINEKIELTSEDYYKQELLYETKINSIRNANKYHQKIYWEKKNNYLILQFQQKHIHGTITFLRPNDKTKDIVLPIKAGTNNQQLIPLSLFVSGMYQIEITWEDSNRTYCQQEMFINY